MTVSGESDANILSTDEEVYGLTCPICKDSLRITKSTILTHCGHFFHEDCLKNWFSSSRTSCCPYCNSSPCELTVKELNTYLESKNEEFWSKKDTIHLLCILILIEVNQEPLNFHPILRVLKNRRFNWNVKEIFEKGIALLHVALENENQDIVDFILQNESESDIQLVKSLLGKNANISKILNLEISDSGSFYSIFCNRKLEVVQNLVESGIDVSLIDETSGKSLIETYAKDEFLEIFTILLESPLINSVANEFTRMIILSDSIQSGNFAITKALLNKNIEISKKMKLSDPKALTRTLKNPLHCAIEMDNLEIVELLIEKGAQFDFKCFKLILDMNKIPMLEKILGKLQDQILADDDNDEIDGDSKYSNSGFSSRLIDKSVQMKVLRMLAKDENLNLFSAILKIRTPKIGMYDASGMTLLHSSIDSGNFKIAKYLLENVTLRIARHNKVDVMTLNLEYADKAGRTPLYLAVEKNNMEIVWNLISKGVRPDAKTIFLTLLKNNLELFNYFVEKKINLNQEDPKTCKCLIALAALDEHLEIFKILIKTEKIELLEDLYEGEGERKLIHASIESGNYEIARYLLNLESEFYRDQLESHIIDTYYYEQNRFLYFANDSCLDILKLAMQSYEIDFGEHSCSEVQPLLHNLIEKDNYECFKYILESEDPFYIQQVKSAINLICIKGKTLLFLACAKNNDEIFKLLLQKGADIELTLPIGYSVLEFLIQGLGNMKIFLTCLEYLKSHPEKLERAKNFANRIENCERKSLLLAISNELQ